MEGNQAGMLPPDRDVMDRADDCGPTTQFNNPQDHILPGYDQNAMIHSKAYGNLPAQGPNTPTFELNNDNPAHFNITTQGPYTAPCVPNQGGSTFFNMSANGLNAISQRQHQSSPNLFAMPYQDLMTLLHGQNHGANNILHKYFSDHIASSDMVHAASKHHPDAQGALSSGGHGGGHGIAGHLSISSQDQHPQFHEQNRTQNRGENREYNEQNSPAQQHNSGTLGQHQGIVHAFHEPSDERTARSPDDNQGGRKSNHASPAQSTAPRLLSGVQSPTSATELSTIPRGRLNSALSGLHTPILAPPRSRTIQHSPPRRAFHSPITPDISSDFPLTAAEISTTNAILSPALATRSMPPIPPPMTRASTNDTESLRHCAAREALIRQRLVLAEYLKKLNLQCFKSSSDERNTLERDLAIGWGRPDANDNLQVLYAGELRLIEVNKLWDKYARGFRMCEEEIEELWGDLVVPDEPRFPGEEAFR